MQLIFQERTDGFRVVRMVGDKEHMLANICTKAAKPTVIDKDKNPFGATEYETLPRAKFTIHSAIGAMTVSDLEEILAKLPKK